MKLASVRVSNELLLQMMTKGWKSVFTECIEGLPEGVRFIDAYVEENSGDPVVVLVVSHDSFEEIPLGHPVPWFGDITFQRWNFPHLEAEFERLKSETI